MGIFIRILIVIVVGLINLLGGRRSVKERKIQINREWLYSEDRSKNGRTAVYMGMRFSAGVSFVLTKESWADCFFKSWGVSEEFQTGDAAFDESVYIACDHPTIHSTLRDDPTLREAIVALFQSGVTRIYADGENLWAKQGDNDATDAQIEALGVLAGELNRIDYNRLTLVHDPFVWKAAVASVVVWGLASYGFGGYNAFFTEGLPPVGIDKALVWGGLKFSAVLAAMFMGGMFMLFHHSSRGHRVIVENFFVILIGFPLFGVALFSDLNEYCDKTAPEIVSAQVVDKASVYHSSRRSHYYTYHFNLKADPRAAHAELNRRVQVYKGLFDQVPVKGSVQVVLRKGALGYPWIEEISPLTK